VEMQSLTWQLVMSQAELTEHPAQSRDEDGSQYTMLQLASTVRCATRSMSHLKLS